MTLRRSVVSFALSAQWWRAVLLVVCGTLVVSDNVAFLMQYYEHRDQYGFFLSPSERDILGQMNQHTLRGQLLCPDPELSYLAAVYTPVRPYYGHQFNTLEYETRHKQALQWFEHGQRGKWFRAIDLTLVRVDQVPDHMLPREWQPMLRNNDWVLYRRWRERERGR